MSVEVIFLAVIAIGIGLAAVLNRHFAAALLAGVAITRVAAVSLHSDLLLPALLAAVCGVAALAGPRPPGTAMHSRRIVPFALTMFAFILLNALSSMWAKDAHASLTVAIQLLMVAVFCVGFIATLQTKRDFRWVIYTIVGGGAALALLSLYQVRSGSFGTSFGGYAVAQVENIAGVTDENRIGGPFADPNFFGQLLIVPVALSAALVASTSSRRRRTFAFATLFLCSAALLVTYSRGALVSFIIVMMLAFGSVRSTRLKKQLVGGAIAVAFVAMLVAPGVYLERVSKIADVVPGVSQGTQQIEDPAIAGRTSALIVGWRMFGNHPVAGVGAGNFPKHYLDYAATVGLDHTGVNLHPHSLPMEIASETGLIGLTMFGALLAALFVRMRRTHRLLRAAGEIEADQFVVGIRNALIGYFVASIFLHDAYPQIMWMLLALAWAGTFLAPTEPEDTPDVRTLTSLRA